LLDSDDRARFEQIVLPHLDAAFNLARWLLRNRADADDVAQDAMLRAYRFFGGYQGGDTRAWLLKIVRNTCYTFLEKNRPAELMTEFDENLSTQASQITDSFNGQVAGQMNSRFGGSPEAQAIAADESARLARALENLPPRFREMLVLRELEGCSYKEIAAVTAVPIGTVMSALSRARKQLQLILTAPQGAHSAAGQGSNS
jgi:RNA polymerase sigma-70 factor (ECF subfamily)